jgi:hypothetical protein
MPTILIAGLLVLAVPFVLSAWPCGQTRSQTAAVAQRLCGAANRRVAKDSLDIKSGNPVVFLAASESRLNVIKPMFGEMTRIKASDDQKDKWNAFISAQRRAVDAMETLRAFAATKPTVGGDAVRTQFLEKVDQILSTGDATKAAAAAYGLSSASEALTCRARRASATPRTITPRRCTSSFSYPAGLREQQVSGTSESTSVAFGDDYSDCGILVDQHAAPSSALGYARQQAASALSTADSYSLIRVAPVRASNISGAEIVRRSTVKGRKEAAHLAFFFGGGKRWVVDCVTSDVNNFDRIDAEQFTPLIASFVAVEMAPK